MDVEDLVIGSGLAAVGTVLGLGHSRSVAVLSGQPEGAFAYYDARRTVPCAFSGRGGLGNDWHGVIPVNGQQLFGTSTQADFASLFAYFYPHALASRQHTELRLFVPWRPIRPRAEWAKLAAVRGSRLRLVNLPATAIDWRGDSSPIEVHCAQGTWRTRRLWLAAGALSTPMLLARAIGPELMRETISDHVFCYIGQADDLPAPPIHRNRDGLTFPCQSVAGADALYSLRPARFGFRELDYGIEQRAVFGLPTGNAVTKIARRLSPGLLAEAFYNRFGLFPHASRYSAYAQVVVNDAYQRTMHPLQPLRARVEAIATRTEVARQAVPFAGVRLSKRPDMVLPGIHLHHSLDLPALAASGVNVLGSPIQVVDASALANIGPEHHSFKMMLAAYCRAQQSAN